MNFGPRWIQVRCKDYDEIEKIIEWAKRNGIISYTVRLCVTDACVNFLYEDVIDQIDVLRQEAEEALLIAELKQETSGIILSKDYTEIRLNKCNSIS